VLIAPATAADAKTAKNRSTVDAKARSGVDLKNPRAVAAEVDRIITEELTRTGAEIAPKTTDDDFLRRVTFDLAGTVPSPGEVALFGLDPDPDKRAKAIDRLLDTDEYARNWSRYWRDVIFSRATDMRARLAEGTFETWMTEQVRANKGWHEIARDLLTATGDVREEGDTALIFAHDGQAPEIAAEASRIFLGIQIQCAECHDHPTDRWKREQFHQLAAFFPRIAVRPKPDAAQRSFEVVSYEPRQGDRREEFFENPERVFSVLDRNRDKKLSKTEVGRTPLARVFDRLVEYGDTNKDGQLSLAELKSMPRPDNMRRGSDEHYMADLSNPSSRGKKMEPVFFVNGKKAKSGLADLERRDAFADYLTSTGNPWFAKAYVNRIWSELLGRGFTMPIDDMGPDRSVVYPEALDLLAEGFAASKYDPQWLFRAVANTEAYQRQIRALNEGDETPPFASGTPARLRADQLFNAIIKVLGVEGADRTEADNDMMPRARFRSPRVQFSFLFGYDPSTPQADLMGNVPQALFMMNSPVVNGLIRGQGQTRLSRLLQEFGDDRDVTKELYVLVLSREPSESELKICLEHVAQVGSRREAFEDVLWSLLNSTEFLTKR